LVEGYFEHTTSNLQPVTFNPMRTIRASEIGTYLYCQRAWTYLKSGFEPLNQAELAAGVKLHEQHGKALMVVGCLRYLAYGLLLLGMVLTVVYIAIYVL
jgi:hypothetical protein